MPSRSVALAFLFLVAFFVIIAAALGYVRFRLPVYYSHENLGRNVASTRARADNEMDVGRTDAVDRGRALRGLAARARGRA